MTWNKITENFRRAFNLLWGMNRVAETSATLDFPSTGAGLQSTLTVSAVGALPGDLVQVSPGNAPEAGLSFDGYVAANDNATVVVINNTAVAIDPASRPYTVVVTRRSR